MTSVGVVDRSRWYVLQTKPKQETRAEANLRRWGISTLAPKLREQRRSLTGQPSERIVPLFSNYVFARFDAEALVAKIRLTRGIQRVVGFGECATPVDDRIIQLIQSRTNEAGFVRLDEVREGDTVVIVRGPLQSLHGVFERHTCAHDRVVILLTTIGCRARVEVAKASIRKLAESA